MSDTETPQPFATVEDLERRLGKPLEGLDRDRAEALLEDASAIIRAVARGRAWPDPVPDVVRTVCIAMALRAWLNPEGVRQQSLGDLSMTFGSVETGVAMTEEERRLIRGAAGFGIALDSIQLTSGWGGRRTIFVQTDPPSGDLLPWLSE